MALTRDPNYPAEYAQLMDAFSRCADGHPVDAVIEAAANMLMAAIVSQAKSRQASCETFQRYARHIGDGVVCGALANWDRLPQSTDVGVGPN